MHEVEDRRRRDDRHRAARGRVALPALREVAHHAVGGRETERGTTRQHDRIDARDRAQRIQQRELACRGRAAAHFARAHGVGRDEQDGHTGSGPRPVAAAHAGKNVHPS